ncbi:MAG: lysozyme [Pararhizobium sp.]
MPKYGKRITASVAALAFTVIGGFEGTRLQAYPDPVSHGAPYTACIGETNGIHKGDRFTMAQCRAMFLHSIEKRYGPGINRCLTHSEKLSDKTYVSFLSFAYNLGPGRFCSSIAPQVNRGQLRAACSHMLQFNKAGRPRRGIRGLDNRRKAEARLCLEGLR